MLFTTMSHQFIFSTNGNLCCGPPVRLGVTPQGRAVPHRALKEKHTLQGADEGPVGIERHRHQRWGRAQRVDTDVEKSGACEQG